MPVHLVTGVPRAVVETPVRPPGCDRQDVVRNVRAFMREVQPVGAVHLPFRGLIQDSTPFRVPGSGRLRNSALVEMPVRPQGSGLGCLPIRSLQQGGTARGRRAVSSASSAGSSRSPLTVAEARDALRTVVSMPFKSPRIARLSSSAPSRPGSSTGPVVPRSLHRESFQPVRLLWRFLSRSSRSKTTLVT